MIRVEFCIDDMAALAVADSLGADSIELCAALETGGVTPSPGAMEKAAGNGTPIHVLIRPRAGGFVYSAAEVDQMARDVDTAWASGLAGVVVGAVARDGNLDLGALRQLRAAAQGLDLTLHRCIDTLADPVRAVEEAMGLGFRRVLTSGGAASAADGVKTLANMVEAAGQSIDIVAGAGLRPGNVAEVIRRTGVRSVHGSCTVAKADPAGQGLFSNGSLARFDPRVAQSFLDAARRALY